VELEKIRRAQRLAVPIREAWDFFPDPRNLRDLTPPALGFETTSEPAATMHPGMIIS